MVVAAVKGLLEELGKLGDEPRLHGVRGVGTETVVDVKSLDGPVVVRRLALDAEDAGVNAALRDRDAVDFVEAKEPVAGEAPEDGASIL